RLTGDAPEQLLPSRPPLAVSRLWTLCSELSIANEDREGCKGYNERTATVGGAVALTSVQATLGRSWPRIWGRRGQAQRCAQRPERRTPGRVEAAHISRVAWLDAAR